MYKALIDIGEFKAGEEVPIEKALVWKDMYVVSPVEEVSSAPVAVEKEVVETVKSSKKVFKKK